jgi:phosphomannomutase
MLQHAVQCGLLAAGCEVIDVGVLPTPTIQIYTGATRARGGLAITASHNPLEYNALKMFNAQGLFFNHYERGELLDIYHQSAVREATNEEIRRVTADPTGPEKLHVDRVLQHVDADRIRARRFRVALDGVNGAGSRMSVRFLRDVLGCELNAISVDPEKPFPRVAEPRPDTLGALAALVRESASDIGFGQDPDGDRLAVADEHGFILDNDDVLALVIEAVLERNPGPVVVNLTTSAVVDDIAHRYGVEVHRTPVGEANVVDTMQSVKAVIGGEGNNGGIIFPAVHYCRDSYTGMAFLLDHLARTSARVSELHGRLPRYYRKLGQVAFEHGRLGSLMQALEDAFPAAIKDRSDGLKLILAEGWIHVRASNTEPILRLAAEAKSQEHLKELYGTLARVLTPDS